MHFNPANRWLKVSVILTVGVAMLASFSLVPAARAENTRHTDGRGSLKLVMPAAGSVPAAKGRQGAEDFLRAYQGEFKLPPDLANLELVLVRESLLGSHYRYRQLLNGVPVQGADLVVSISRESGQVFQAYNNTYPVESDVAMPGTLIGEAAALDAAWNQLRVHGNLLGKPRAELIYLPENGGFRLAYQTYIPVEAPFGYWELHLDAVTGKVLEVRDSAINESKQSGELPDFAAYTGLIWPRGETTRQWEARAAVRKSEGSLDKNTVDGSTVVFDGDPRTYLANAALVDSSPASAFTAAYVPRVLRDISETNGIYSLEGPWVTIADFEAPATPPSTTTDGHWTALRGVNAFDDVMVYFHIDQSQRYLQSLGYSNATGIQFGPIQADSDGLSGADNSHFIPSSNQLAFGHGGVDDDEDADVILHEYGHAITHSIAPSWSGGDSGAIGEGFGDYWGASYSSTTTNGQTFHPEWAFSFDGHTADSWPGRFLDMTNLTYDPSRTYSAHQTISGIANYSDQLWSAPLFQAFLTLQGLGYPRTNIDRVVLESFFGLGSGVTMRDLANATVNAAALLFPAGPYAEVFRVKFRNQLILPPPPLPTPVLIYPVGGEVLSAGSVAQVQWDRQGAPAAAAARLEYSAGATSSFLDNMESGVNGWVVSRGSGATNWTQSTASSHSSSHSWFAPDLATLTDLYLRSPLLAIGNGDVLSFWHSYTTESGFDGGVVELSTNGTTWVDIGTGSTQNGYKGTISTSYSSAIAGRAAFTGSSGGYVETRIPLSAYSGQSVYIRFRATSDTSVSSSGWYVDDVSIGKQWVAIGATPTNAASYLWTLPSVPGTNYVLRVQQFAPGYSDSAWAQSGSFTIANQTPPLITSLTLTNGAATITWSAVAGKTYRVEYKTNLTDAAWLPLAPDVIAGGPTAAFTDQPLAKTRFYHVLAP